MRRARGILLIVGVLIFLVSVMFAPSVFSFRTASGQVATSPYAGSEACFKCHPGEFNDWKVSGHPYILIPAEQAKNMPLPLPAGYSWDDISYVVGGYKWKARYLDKKGFFITTAAGKPGKNQYNLMTGAWADYEAGKVKKYDCGRCHTTGYSPEGSQGGLPGIVGTWVFPGVGCESCHGPGQAHIAAGGDKKLIATDRSAWFCGNCHIRGKATTIPAVGGFIQHHEQFNEHLASPHRKLACVDCHDPHKKAEFSIRTTCASCHSAAQAAFAGSTMQRVGVRCVDCHMPMATKSAVSLGPYKGDVKTHLFLIKTDPEAKMFTPDGAFAKHYVTLDFACLQCHQDKTVKWAAQYAKGIHSLGKRKK
ncbi:MAG: cytochrome c3 family protein [Armatimonadota bacterium]|nr:cytochrome c3 family protein [Armatimonadota bacterium]